VAVAGRAEAQMRQGTRPGFFEASVGPLVGITDPGRLCERVVAHESARKLLMFAMQRCPRDSDARMRLEVVLQAIPTGP